MIEKLHCNLYSVQKEGRSINTSKLKKTFIKGFCLAMIKEYNNFMGGFDLHDILNALYSFPLRAKRWYVYIVYYTIHIMVVNAWLRYRKHAQLLQVKPVMKLAVFPSRLAYNGDANCDSRAPPKLV